MKIHAPTKPETDDTERVDVSRGAVTFDPWPFEDRSIKLNRGTRWLSSAGDSLESDLAYGLVEGTDNTLAWTTHNNQVVMDEHTWNQLVERDIK